MGDPDPARLILPIGTQATTRVELPATVEPGAVARKLEGTGHGTLPGSEMQYHDAEYNGLRAELTAAGWTSILPKIASAKSSLNDLLARVRTCHREG